MESGLLEYAIKVLQTQKIITGGDAKNLGPGAMTHKRWQDFYTTLVKSKILKPNLNIKKAYTLDYLEKH